MITCREVRSRAKSHIRAKRVTQLPGLTVATVNSTSLWMSEELNSVSLKFSQVLKGSSPWRSELMMPSSGPRKVMTPWKDARNEVR